MNDDGYVRRMRRWLVLAAVAALAAGCSSGDDGPVDDPVDATTSTLAPAPADEAATAEAGASEAMVDDVAPVEWTVRVDATWSGIDGQPDGSISAALSFDPATASGGPFAAVGSCSGQRALVGAYSVFASQDGRTAINVWTADRVRASGIYDAEVRIEGDGSPLVAGGTMTLLDGLQRGRFLAFVAGGGRIEGDFECTGAPVPTPIDTGVTGDDVLDSVEVFAVLRDGSAERVVGLAADAAADVRCPAVSGDDAPGVVLEARGDAGLGAITSFELAEPDVLRLAVAGETYEFADVVLALSEDGTSGSFGAVSGTTSIEGAFRCT